MLRLWLSLAVDFEGDGSPPPLPNLDLKLVVGDTIAGPDPKQFDFTSVDIANSGLREDIAEYTTALGQRKATLKEKVGATRQQLRDTLRGAAPSGTVEWRIDFADVMLNGGFDIVIANPPYVRQEEITPKSYKDALVKQYSAAAVGRSDLYCYFYARGLQLLRDGGLHVFVCSNSWLDVGYGAKLQQHLLNSAHVQAIYESALERQFTTADINTIISIIRRVGSTANGDTTTFVSLRDEFDTALADPTKRREIVRTRAGLRSAGTSGRKFVGDKWGGKYLRAPDIYHHVLGKCADQMTRLGDVATVRFGIKTGANRFFYLNAETIERFGIEPRYRRPVMTTPQQSRSVAVRPADLPNQLFLCHQSKRALAGTGALAYIRWGEQQGYHEGASVAARQRWYDLGEKDNVYLGMNKLVGTTARTFLASRGLLFSDNFQIMTSHPETPANQLATAMNSTLFQLVLNTESRANFGEGVLEIQTYETANLRIANPRFLTAPGNAVFRTNNWDVLAPSRERRQIDDAVFDALELTQDEQDAVYEGVKELVENRMTKANT